MDLNDYFENTKGTGVLATADNEGKVDAAIYARPYVMDEKTIAFSMLSRRSYENTQTNPYAAYLFIEAGEGYKGLRLYLTKSGEESDPERIRELKKQHDRIFDKDVIDRHIVYFEITETRPLVGDK